MALARGRRGSSEMNYWPGFVDALSTLVLSIVFLLSVFLVVQFYLSQEVTGKDKAIDELNAKLAQLSDMLSLEKLGKLNLDEQLTSLRAGLAAVQSDRDRIKGLYDGLAGAGADAQGRNTELNKALDSEKQVSSRALAQIEVLNQQISALRRQLAALVGDGAVDLEIGPAALFIGALHAPLQVGEVARHGGAAVLVEEAHQPRAAPHPLHHCRQQ